MRNYLTRRLWSAGDLRFLEPLAQIFKVAASVRSGPSQHRDSTRVLEIAVELTSCVKFAKFESGVGQRLLKVTVATFECIQSVYKVYSSYCKA